MDDFKRKIKSKSGEQTRKMSAERGTPFEGSRHSDDQSSKSTDTVTPFRHLSSSLQLVYIHPTTVH